MWGAPRDTRAFIFPLPWVQTNLKTCSFQLGWPSTFHRFLWGIVEANLFVSKRTPISKNVLNFWSIYYGTYGKARCALQFEGQRWEAQDIVQRAMHDWCEFEEVRGTWAKQVACSTRGTQKNVDRSVELHQTAKINVAAEFQGDNNKVELGG